MMQAYKIMHGMKKVVREKFSPIALDIQFVCSIFGVDTVRHLLTQFLMNS